MIVSFCGRCWTWWWVVATMSGRLQYSVIASVSRDLIPFRWLRAHLFIFLSLLLSFFPYFHLLTRCGLLVVLDAICNGRLSAGLGSLVLLCRTYDPCSSLDIRRLLWISRSQSNLGIEESWLTLDQPAKRKAADGTVIEDEDEEEDVPDRLSSADAWLFPVVSSALNVSRDRGND